ncbi:MAG: hypothetical protein LBO20_03570 [Bifidobacteriaceae bacterium]|nr:hypothetical protein [Bifidobacteriaceae bacterium]
MPTVLKRYHVTEVPELSEALQVARAVWPEETSGTKLIYKLVRAGADHLRENPEVERAARQALAVRLAGRHPSPSGREGLAELRQEWRR